MLHLTHWRIRCTATSKHLQVFVTAHESVTAMSAKMHEALKRQNYVTPTNYLEFVGGYKTLLKEKTEALTDKAGKLRGGMTKLNETAVQVGEMQARVDSFCTHELCAALDTDCASQFQLA